MRDGMCRTTTVAAMVLLTTIAVGQPVDGSPPRPAACFVPRRDRRFLFIVSAKY